MLGKSVGVPAVEGHGKGVWKGAKGVLVGGKKNVEGQNTTTYAHEGAKRIAGC